MSKAKPICRKCDAKLVIDENWYACTAKLNSYICNRCASAYSKQRYKDNSKARNKQYPFIENKECASFLGCHVAERVLSHVFKDVKRMPYGHPGYDFICNRGKRIDVKSACQRKHKRKHGWTFHITRNKTADYFLCLAFDNREDLNPMHLWLIPGDVVNDRVGVYISPSTVAKWDEFAFDTDEIVTCCSTMKD